MWFEAIKWIEEMAVLRLLLLLLPPNSRSFSHSLSAFCLTALFNWLCDFRVMLSAWNLLLWRSIRTSLEMNPSGVSAFDSNASFGIIYIICTFGCTSLLCYIHFLIVYARFLFWFIFGVSVVLLLLMFCSIHLLCRKILCSRTICEQSLYPENFFGIAFDNKEKTI